MKSLSGLLQSTDPREEVIRTTEIISGKLSALGLDGFYEKYFNDSNQVLIKLLSLIETYLSERRFIRLSDAIFVFGVILHKSPLLEDETLTYIQGYFILK